MEVMNNPLFENKKVNTEKILSFGFEYKDGAYSYCVDIADGQFKMIVLISKDEQLKTDIIEISSGEKYTLHLVQSASGPFVGKIKEEYENILSSIAKNCFEKDVFKSEYSKAVIQYIKEKYEDELEFLWEKFSNNAIFRRKDNSKWYAALLIIPKNKLGLKDEGTIEIIDLRGDISFIENFVDHKKYFPGYHMNKKHWLTICLDGSVKKEEIFKRIDSSYNLAQKR